MSMRLLNCALAAVVFVSVVPTARAVQIQMTSPQAGQTVGPGDQVQIEITVVNETPRLDAVIVDVVIVADPLAIPEAGGFLGPDNALFRFTLDGLEEKKISWGRTVPDLSLGEPFVVTVEMTADGKVSKTKDTAALPFIMDPGKEP